jgi:glycerophosphoryl diester phosphodiesterase
MQSLLFAPLEGLISRAPSPERVAFLKSQPFAHRGLHGRDRVENSRAAFRAAIKLGHGIELDVQAASGGEAFVFHDAELSRLTPQTGLVSERRASDLETVMLAGTDETIPRLEEILTIVAGRVPVLIEVKSHDANPVPLCHAVRRALEGYNGAVAVMSFNPQVAHWFGEHAPRVVRGLVVSEQGEGRFGGSAKRFASLLRARPDFLAYDVRDLPSRFATSARKRGIPVLTWTVRDARAEATAFDYADEAIYEKPA